jgi:predicted alpha/beta hydrolase family esterase
MIELGTRGLPVVGLATDQFDRFSRQVLRQRNAGELPVVVIAHPLGGIPSSQAKDRITAEVLGAVVRALTASDKCDSENA